MDVAIVKTGTANMASVAAALRRLGCEPRITESVSDVVEAERLVLPGVGTLAAAMERIESMDMVSALKKRMEEGSPTLAICLGMQVLCEGSEESPDVEGLGVIPGTTKRFPEGLRVPQLGWNLIEVEAEAEVLRTGYVYFANSYRLVEVPEGWRVARCDYGGEFIAAVERGPVVACQFHPELSGRLGMDIIERWVNM